MDDKIKFGFVALGIIIFQSILKLYGVLITGSLSFLSETLDTFVDIVFVSITLYSLHQSQKPPDYEHMYGHSKIDSIGALIQGIILINLYILLIFNAIFVIISGTYSINNPILGLKILIISFLVNILFSRILIWQGRKHNSLTLEIQGLNLFQDSLRALVVMVSLILALYGIVFLDLLLSIALSIWIIFIALKTARNGVKDLADTNPINLYVLEELRQKIFQLDHVNGVNTLKTRVSGNKLYIDVSLSVEDHISIIHAHEITKSIKSLSKNLLPLYDVECLIQMNPLGGEKSAGERIIKLIYSIKADFPEIIDFKDIYLFKLNENYFLSILFIVEQHLSLAKAHDICTEFEKELKIEAPIISRIVSHIEAQPKSKVRFINQLECQEIEQAKLKEIETIIEEVLKKHKNVKGYHGFEFWTIFDYCMLEMHIFFPGNLNISIVHNYLTEIEREICNKLKNYNLKEIILHSEPIKGRSDGVLFDK
ncbi:MAG: cation diffusion facilitator family transporter [Promethearchaeota archaeon]